MIEVKKVENGKMLNEFIKVQWVIYENDPYWAPPVIMDLKDRLNKKKNPFFEHAEADYFIAYKDGKPVGRIAAIIDHYHNDYYKEKTGFWGFFESIDDQEVANALFDTAKEWNKERGMNLMRGPMSFGTNDECAMLLEGFEMREVIMMPYNPKYYIDLCANYGMKKAKDLLAFHLDMEKPIPPKVKSIAEHVRKKQERKGLTVRFMQKKHLKRDIRVVMDVYEEAWKDNWGFVPMSEKEFNNLASNLALITEENLVVIIEDNGEPIGVAASIYDLMEVTYGLRHLHNKPLWYQSLRQLLAIAGRVFFRKKNKFEWARLIIAGLKPGYRQRGIDAFLYVIPFEEGKKLGIKHGELSWELEDNVRINKAIEKMGAEVYKKYRIWDIEI